MPAKIRKKSNKKTELPFVSVCTPTFNRRPFISSMIKCFDHQKYPKDKMEWIIIDDGTDPIEDLVSSHPNVKYFKYSEKMSLGKKRNIMHEKSKGEIIVYMDDDDYYPPERVSHSVEMLQTHPKVLCAGTSEIYIYFHELEKVYQFGPYSPNHATAGTFAFKRQLLNDHRYNDTAALAEEKEFLKNYTVPFIQLEPKKVILVFSHEHNTFDKRKLLKSPNDYIKVSDKTVDDFVKQADLKQFYMHDIHENIKTYKPGLPEMKPDVIKQTKEIEERRAKENASNGKVVMQDANGNNKELTTAEVVQIIQGLQRENKELKENGGGGQIMMETPDGNKALSNNDVAQLIKALQQENLQMKEHIKNYSSDRTIEEVQSFDNSNKQLIITDEDDNMEILDYEEVSDYINSKIDLIKYLKKNTSGTNQEDVQVVPVAEPVAEPVDNSILIDMVKNIDNKLNILTERVESNNSSDNKKGFFKEVDGKNVKMSYEEINNIIQEQQKIIDYAKKELENASIYYKDNTGTVNTLTQESFDYIVNKLKNNQIDDNCNITFDLVQGQDEQESSGDEDEDEDVDDANDKEEDSK